MPYRPHKPEDRARLEKLIEEIGQRIEMDKTTLERLNEELVQGQWYLSDEHYARIFNAESGE